MKKIALQAVKLAGDVQMKNLGKVKQISEKDRSNFVTNIDIYIEKKIFALIKKKYPQHNLFGEETKPIDNGSDYTWILDPVDGTNNYIHQVPFFNVSLALRYKNEIIMAAIYNPAIDELFFAEKGKPSILNNKRIRVSKTNNFSRAHFDMGIYEEKSLTPKLAKLVTNNFKRFARRRSAALEICYVACGRSDAFLFPKLFLHDYAAGSLILKNAGGKITDWQNKKLPMDSKRTDFLATNGKIHNHLLKILK